MPDRDGYPTPYELDEDHTEENMELYDMKDD